MHPHISHLLHCIELEEQEEVRRFRMDEQHTLRQLKAEGLALHPLIVTGKSFGYADYPEINFKLQFPPGQHLFRDGVAIECFCKDAAPVKGVLLSMEGKQGTVRLFAPDFPEWIEDDGVGIKLAPDTRTAGIMKDSLKRLQHNPQLLQLFQQIHGELPMPESLAETNTLQPTTPGELNESQRRAVTAIVEQKHLTIVHGPPGTGKTTTLVAGIVALVQKGCKVLVAAPSNAAVDHIAKQLLQKRIQLVRAGNTSKTDPILLPHTPEGQLQQSKTAKEIKALKIRAEEFRKMALKYKRSFGKAEREQRALLFQEVKQIRQQIKQLQQYNEEKMYGDAQVICGTPVGLVDAPLSKYEFDALVLDEAGQCIEPLAWCIFPKTNRWILAGDHWQLPPTVLSQEAVRKGFNQSILETAIAHSKQVYLLEVQYRMRRAIAGFSSRYFYQDLLQTASHLDNRGTHITFIDTAGSGFTEQTGPDGTSLQNQGELQIVQHLLQHEAWAPGTTTFISPYAGQVAAAREMLPAQVRLSTIDSYQGQEQLVVLLSLVRSNDSGEIGFLKDYRRMNVAITRAKEQLVVIGDSATVGADAFYDQFISYTQEHGAYRTVWELGIL